MPRGHRNRHHHEDSDSSSDSHLSRRNRSSDGDVDPHFVFDLRDIDEQIQEEVDYVVDNLDRSPDADGKFWYAKERDGGSRVGRWGGGDSGQSMDAGLLQINGEASIYEHKLNVAKIKAAKVDEDDQKGFEVDVKAVSADAKLGPARVNVSALGAGYEVGIGRNTGGFVRANVASVGGSVGPVGASVGVGFDTGARAGADGVEVQLLGCGGMIDKNEGIGISLFGSTFKFKPW